MNRELIDAALGGRWDEVDRLVKLPHGLDQMDEGDNNILHLLVTASRTRSVGQEGSRHLVEIKEEVFLEITRKVMREMPCLSLAKNKDGHTPVFLAFERALWKMACILAGDDGVYLPLKEKSYCGENLLHLIGRSPSHNGSRTRLEDYSEEQCYLGRLIVHLDPSMVNEPDERLRRPLHATCVSLNHKFAVFLSKNGVDANTHCLSVRAMAAAAYVNPEGPIPKPEADTSPMCLLLQLVPSPDTRGLTKDERSAKILEIKRMIEVLFLCGWDRSRDCLGYLIDSLARDKDLFLLPNQYLGPLKPETKPKKKKGAAR